MEKVKLILRWIFVPCSFVLGYILSSILINNLVLNLVENFFTGEKVVSFITDVIVSAIVPYVSIFIVYHLSPKYNKEVSLVFSIIGIVIASLSAGISIVSRDGNMLVFTIVSVLGFVYSIYKFYIKGGNGID